MEQTREIQAILLNTTLLNVNVRHLSKEICIRDNESLFLLKKTIGLFEHLQNTHNSMCFSHLQQVFGGGKEAPFHNEMKKCN